ncbi:MAG: hypothetical protein FWB96_05005 [Defluviitaleaceae bacterium]|nr:hypothetical protein [Defluviitaleaceae bacterium]MCL2262208.1 hypothetical protein [Defluviitaleaceae bacterium]
MQNSDFEAGINYRNEGDTKNAFVFLERAAKSGHPEAAFHMAWFYYDIGKELIEPGKHDKAMEWLDKSASLGNEKAMQQILTLLSRPDFNAPEKSEFFMKWITKLAERKEPVYMVELAEIYGLSESCPFFETLPELRKKADPDKSFELCDAVSKLVLADKIALPFVIYSKIAQGFRREKNRIRAGEKQSSDREHLMYLLKMQLLFDEEALESAKKNNAPQEYINFQQNIVDADKGELEAVRNLH